MIHGHTHTHSCEIQLGDIQSEEERDIVLELSLPIVDGSSEVEGAVLRVKLSYFDVLSSTLVDDAHTDLVITRRGMTIYVYVNSYTKLYMHIGAHCFPLLLCHVMIM